MALLCGRFSSRLVPPSRPWQSQQHLRLGEDDLGLPGAKTLEQEKQEGLGADSVGLTILFQNNCTHESYDFGIS